MGVPLATPIAFYTDEIMLEFVAGALLCYYLPVLVRAPRHVAVAMFCFGWIMLIALPESNGGLLHALLFGSASFLIVAGAVLREAKYGMPTWETMKLLGDASYSIYLSHAVSLAGIRTFWRPLIGMDSWVSCFVFIIVATFASIVAGVFVYWYVERPLTAFFQQFAKPRRGKNAVQESESAH